MYEIPCEIIRDLLPSYVDRLTSETSNSCIRAHIADCADCKKVLDHMQEEEERPHVIAQAEKKEIDFLRKNKKKNRIILIASLAAAVLIALLILFISRYVIGYYREDPYGDWYQCEVELDEDQLSMQISSVQNSLRITSVSFHGNGDGTLEGKIMSVPAGVVARLLYGTEYQTTLNISNMLGEGEKVERIVLNERVVWENGKNISLLSSALYQTVHPFIGDMPANSKTANALNLAAWLGPYSNQLETGEAPYVWKLLLEQDIPAKRKAQREAEMERFGYALLASVGNLDQVTFLYTSEGKQEETSITAQQASDFFGQDIKNCMDSVSTMDELLAKAGLLEYAYSEPLFYETGQDMSIFLVVNETHEAIASIGMDVYQDGKLVSSQHGMNADETELQKGDLLTMAVYEADIEGSFADRTVLALKFQVTTDSGKTYEVNEMMRIPSCAGQLSDFHITGNAVEGFHVSQ